MLLSKSLFSHYSTITRISSKLSHHTQICVYMCAHMNSSVTFTIWGRWRKISAGKSWKTTSLRNSQALASMVTSLLCKDLPKKVPHFTTILSWNMPVHGNVPVLQIYQRRYHTPQHTGFHDKLFHAISGELGHDHAQAHSKRVLLSGVIPSLVCKLSAPSSIFTHSYT